MSQVTEYLAFLGLVRWLGDLTTSWVDENVP